MRRAWFLRSLLALLRLLEMVDTLSPGASGYCFCYPVALVLSYPREFSGNRSLVWMEDDTPHQFANSIIYSLAVEWAGARYEPPTSGVPLVTHERNTSLFPSALCPGAFCLVFLRSLTNFAEFPIRLYGGDE